MPLIVRDLAKIQKYLILVCIQLGKKALVIDLPIVSDVFQAIDVIPEDDENIGIIDQTQAFT